MTGTYSSELLLPRVVTIDGDPGAGKTTMAKLVAERLGYQNLTSGMFYCAGGLAIARAGLPAASRMTIDEALSSTDITFELQVGYDPLVSIDGIDVSDRLFDYENKRLATRLSDNEHFSKLVTQTIRNMSHEGRWVVDRGFRNFPDADVKIWLQADRYTRAVRRCGQLASQGIHMPLDRIMAEDAERSAKDSRVRTIPMEARIINTNELDVEPTYYLVEQAIVRDTHH